MIKRRIIEEVEFVRFLIIFFLDIIIFSDKLMRLIKCMISRRVM